MTPICPTCKRVIANEDVNVASDVAFCRACSVAHKLSGLVHSVPIVEVDLNRPPQGAWQRQIGMGAVIGATHRSVGLALGMLAISLFWNGITSVFVALALSSTLQHLGIAAPGWLPIPKMNGTAMGVGLTIFLWVFLTPFILIGLAMIAAFLSSLGGRTEVRIRQSEGIVFNGIGSIGRRQRFNAETVNDVRIEDQNRRDSDGGRQSKKYIIVESDDGKQLKFGSSLRDDRMKFVAAATREALLSRMAGRKLIS